MRQIIIAKKLCLKRKKTISIVVLLMLIFCGILTTSCTTARYGDKFVLNNQVADQYSFKVYVGGFQFAPPNADAEERIKEFMAGSDYKSYEIVNSRYNLVPSYYEFTVCFTKAKEAKD